MSVEKNIELHKRWFQEVWNEKRVATIQELLDENFCGQGQDQPGVEIRGPKEFGVFFDRLNGAFPDMKVELLDAFGAGDKTALRWSAKMTHKGDHLGMPATNKSVEITGISIARFANGKIIEGWDSWDQLSMLQQLSAAAVAGA
jgi:steroid delta-isomerase-like uncharacterized protein